MGRRGGRARPSPFQIEMMMVPMSGPQGLYFPYSAMVGGYDMSSFNPQYSQGRISDHEVGAMVNEVNSCSLAKVGVCDHTLWLICVVFLCIAVGTPLSMISAASSMASSSSGSGGFILRIILIPILGMVVLVLIICMGSCKYAKRMRLRQMAISSIVNKHQQQTFAPKQAVAKLSPHGAYLMIQFCWPGVAVPQMNMMQGQPQMAMMMAY